MTRGWAPTDSTSAVTAGSLVVSTQGAPLNIEASAASIPDASFPHIGWPPTRSIPDAAAPSMTLSFVLAMSVITLPSTRPRRFENTFFSPRIGTATTTMSATSTTERSALALSTMPRSNALRMVIASGSLPTTTRLGCASLSARASEDPIRPKPTIATAGMCGFGLRELPGHRAQQPPEVLHQAIEVLEIEGLRSVRQRLIRRGMHLDDQPMRAGGHSRQGKGPHERPPAGRLRRVDDYRQVRQLSRQRDRVQVEREAGRGFEGTDAPLAQDHVAVALRQDILGGEQPFLDGRRHSPLQQDRLARAAGLLEQRVVLHVAGAELEDVGIARHQLDVARRHHLCHDLEAGLLASQRHHLQGRFAQALKRIGRGARLERAATQDRRSLGGHVPGGLEEHLLTFDRARSGHHHDLFASDLHAADVDHCVLRPELAARQLERLGDRDDLVDGVEVGERLLVGIGVAADHSDESALLAPRELALEPDLVDAIDHRFDVGVGRAVRHDDDHGMTVPFSESRSALIALAPRR